MKPFYGNILCLCIFLLLIPIATPFKNETDRNSTRLKSNHPYSNLWFLQRGVGIIGILLNCLGKFTINCFILWGKLNNITYAYAYMQSSG